MFVVSAPDPDVRVTALGDKVFRHGMDLVVALHLLVVWHDVVREYFAAHLDGDVVLALGHPESQYLLAAVAENGGPEVFFSERSEGHLLPHCVLLTLLTNS